MADLRALAVCGALLVGAATGCRSTPASAAADGPRILAVIAHPDDEIAFAATMFKTATWLGGVCDIVVITNGEGGYKYSTLGELVYGVRLTEASIGRARLPAIRRREMLEGCALLQVHDVTFLSQTDHRYTLDAAEVLAAAAHVWDLPRVRAALAAALRTGDYDFVLTHLPVLETHGHHKAATILALEAVAALPRAQRPVVLGTYAGSGEEAAPPVTPVADYPLTAFRADVGPWVFDRAQKFGYRDRLDYQIVVNWAIAEHKSQGTMQQLMGRTGKESFYLYALDVPDAVARTEALFRRLAEPQFAPLDYDDNGESR